MKRGADHGGAALHERAWYRVFGARINKQDLERTGFVTHDLVGCDLCANSFHVYRLGTLVHLCRSYVRLNKPAVHGSVLAKLASECTSVDSLNSRDARAAEPFAQTPLRGVMARPVRVVQNN